MADKPAAEGEGPSPSKSPTGRASSVFFALLPVAFLAGLVALLTAQDLRQVAGSDIPPVEELVFERVRLEGSSAPGGYGLILDVRNDGPDPVQVAQVLVDEAYWSFQMTPEDGLLGRLESGQITIPYHWVEGEAHEVAVLTATGLTFSHVIEVAVESPRVSPKFLGFFALMGLYVGVLPIAIGLLWFPALRRLSRRGWRFILFLTVGLLVFLGVDTLTEGLELAGGESVPETFHPTVLFLLIAAATYLLLQVMSARRRSGTGGGDPWREQLNLAYLVALGIGLHNLGEGLAIGAAYNAGELALGATLVVGFAVHNTTEGLAIISPIVREQVGWRRLMTHLVMLGLLAGVPTIPGAWIGGFARSSLWGVAFLAIGVGAIFQVVYAITAQMARRVQSPRELLDWTNLLGLASGAALMFGTALLV